MKTGLYQLHDTVAQQTLGVILKEKHRNAAVRDFYSILADKDTLPGQHPKDFELRKVGEQDEATGEITPTVPPETITTGEEWLSKMQQEQDIARVREQMGG